MAINSHRTQPCSGEHMTVEEYFQLDSTYPNVKYEYQGGAVWLMSGGSREHDAIAFAMRMALELQFQTGPCSVSGSDVRVQVSEDATYYFPDVTVSCDVADRRRGNTLIRSPRVVVEVLSPSTEKFDRTEKMKMYQSWPTIQEVVLISQFAPHVEVFRRGRHEERAWSYTLYGPGEIVVLESVDVSIPIEEIYRKIDFDEPLLGE